MKWFVFGMKIFYYEIRRYVVYHTYLIPLKTKLDYNELCNKIQELCYCLET